MRIILIGLFFFIQLLSTAQNIPVGSWRSHVDYSTVTQLTVFKDKVFSATPNGLFYYDLEDQSLQTIGTVDGLSGLRITAMLAIESQSKLLIGYEDGHLDILNESLEISTFNALFTADIGGSKKINDLQYAAETVYIATDFGIVLYDVSNNQLIDTYLNLSSSGDVLPINSILISEGNLYASSSEGLLIGDLTANINLKDFQNWNRFPSPVVEGELLKAVQFDGQTYAWFDDNSIQNLNGMEWELIYQANTSIRGLTTFENQLLLLEGNELKQFQNDDFTTEIALATNILINDVITHGADYFFATESDGLVFYQSGSETKLKPQGPVGELKSLFQIEQFTFHLGVDQPGFSYFENGRWQYVSQDINGNLLPEFSDVALDLISGNGIFLSEEEGLFSWDTEKIQALGTANINIAKWLKLAEGPNGNLWTVVLNDSNSYALLNASQNELISLDLNPNRTIKDYLIAFNGDHYFSTDFGLYVFNPASNKSRVLNSSLGNGNLPGNQILDITFDLNSQLWIGTERGLAFFNNFAGVLEDENVDASKPVFEGFFLFDDIPVNHILVDGGNRKWMSTRDGLWLFDENIQENLLHLRRVNSPIIDNNIQQMVVNPISGELFLSSENQFLSYRTDASRAGSSHSTVEVFPNPVRQSMDTYVSIRGLAYNNEVMITDLAGNLIHKGKANGGTFSWNLTNYAGFKARAGVYLVFSINQDGTETYQTKFIIIP